MTLNKKIISLFILSFLLFSCGKDDFTKWNLNIVPTKENKITKKIEFQKFEEEIKYNKSKGILTIGNNVTIKEWISNLPKEIKIYKNAKTYINSNVANYIFFISPQKEEINTIWKYYISMFNKLWYERIIEEQINIEKVQNKENKIENSTNLSNLEFVLKNEKYKLWKNWLSINWEKEFKQRILINIHDNTPKNIKEWMWLEWKYIEIYYNQN